MSYIILIFIVIFFIVILFFVKNKIRLILISFLILLILILNLIRIINKPKILKKEDYYGTYIIDTTKYYGINSKWQYDNFKFEIKNNDSIYFYTKKQIYKGSINTVKPYKSEILVINIKEPKHHILSSNPTVYRDVWSFYLVFESSLFHNVFFKKI